VPVHARDRKPLRPLICEIPGSTSLCLLSDAYPGKVRPVFGLSRQSCLCTANCRPGRPIQY
jgi:hypothetical protein